MIPRLFRTDASKAVKQSSVNAINPSVHSRYSSELVPMMVWRNKVDPTQIRRDRDMAAVIFSELTQCHAIPYSVRPSYD
jgi:hypothetical protein